MKKILALLLALTMVMSLAACGSKTEAPTEAPATEAPATAAPATAAPATEAPAAELTDAEKEAEIRNAIALLFDRNYIAEEIGQAGQLPASSFVAMGMTDADGSEFYQNAGSSDDYYGYYDVSEDAYLDNWD